LVMTTCVATSDYGSNGKATRYVVLLCMSGIEIQNFLLNTVLWGPLTDGLFPSGSLYIVFRNAIRCSHLAHPCKWEQTKPLLVVLTRFEVGYSTIRSSPCSLGLSATSQRYFSLRTNQPPATSQHYSSLWTNQQQPSVTSQPNRLHVCSANLCTYVNTLNSLVSTIRMQFMPAHRIIYCGNPSIYL
jgi:hypothetical protein